MKLKRRNEILLVGSMRDIERFVMSHYVSVHTSDKELEGILDERFALFNPDKVSGTDPDSGATWEEVKEAYKSYAKQALHKRKKEYEELMGGK